MGTVYLAETDGGRRVALKVLHPHLVGEPGFLRRLRAEGAFGQRIRHPNVVATLDANEASADGEPVFYLATEYVEGQTLRALLDELGRVPEELCRHVAHEVAAGLEAIHAAGIVHRDLKPENVLITREHQVKVMDLGVARSLRGTLRTSDAGSFAGTVLYAAPEQFTADRFDGRADLYALGLVLYELATGRHPFAGDAIDIPAVVQQQLHEHPPPLSELEPGTSAFFEAVVDCLLAKDPGRRFAGAAALRRALEEGENGAWWTERAAAIRRDTRRPPRRIRVPRETALLGRDRELERMEAAWRDVRAGRGRTILVEGEPGVGKTRLCDEFVARVQDDAGASDLHLLLGAYLPGGGASGSGAFSTAYREHFAGEDLAHALERYLPETPSLAPAFAALLRGEPPPPGAPALTRDALPEVFLQVTAALADERPTIVLVDDLQDAPREGRALMARLSAGLADRRVLLLGTLRPGADEGELAGVARLPHVLRIGLERLGPKDLGRLLVAALGSDALAEELGFRIAEKSDGNPFFALEIVRSLREGGFLEQAADGTWVRARTIDRIGIPSSILDLIRARIEALEPEERDLLEVAACCGPRFDPSLVAEALGLELVPALKRFAAIERRHHMIRSVGRGCLFDHHQVREALYDDLLPQLREHYHRMIGEVLERRARAADAEEALAVQACEHFLRGSDPQRARPLLERAFAHVRRGYGNQAPIELADLALAAPGFLAGGERADMLLRKAGFLDLAGRRVEQREALDEARALALDLDRPALQARIEGQIGWLLTQVADYEEAKATLDGALALARHAGDEPVEAEVRGFLGVWHTERRDYAEAQRHLERQLAIARDRGLRDAESSAVCNLGNVAFHRGERERAREFHERHLELARAAGDRRGEAIAYGNLGNLAFEDGELEEAYRLHERYQELAREIGYRRGEARALGALGIDARRLGRYEEADRHYRRYRDLSRAVQNRLGEGYAQINRARVRLLLGDLEQAEACVADGMGILSGIGARHARAHGLVLRGELATARGQTAEARRLYAEAAESARETGEDATRAAALVATAALTDDPAPLAEALPLLPDPRSGMRLLALAHRARLGDGDADGVARALAECEHRLDVHTRMELHHLLDGLRPGGGHAEAARALLDTVVAHAPEELRARIAERIPLYRAVAAAAPPR